MYGQYVSTLWYRISRSNSLYRETNARVLTRVVSWLTNSCQLLISWRGNIVSCGGANDPAIFLILVSLIVLRLVWYGVRISRRLHEALPRCEHTERSSATHCVSSRRYRLCRCRWWQGRRCRQRWAWPFSYFCVMLLVMCYCCVPHEYLRN